MTTPAFRTIVVRHADVDLLVDVDKQVTIGRSQEATFHVDSPLVSRLHAELTWRDGGWVLTDRGSLNGIWVNGRAIHEIAIDAQTEVRLGNPQTGPLLVFIPALSQALTQLRGAALVPPVRRRVEHASLATARGHLHPTGQSIGRAPDSAIVVDDAQVSRNHARLIGTTAGLVIEDLHSANGTFVNGARADRTVLYEGDIVTVGHSDFVVWGGELHPRDRQPSDAGLQLNQVGYIVENGKKLLVDVTVAAAPGSLTAVIGPSGAGKTTLAKVIAGSERPSIGVVTFDGHDLHADFDALRSRIGIVPQDDVLHRQLTVDQALSYAAKLRLAPDTTADDRARVIDSVLAELGLLEHKDTRVDKLSGGQRKRASVALELLTSPSLLILDEPTSGLDPYLDRQVMVMLRQLADAGRVVIVITHSLTYLDMCDQVLLLAPGGKTAYCGHPGGVGELLGSTDWAEIFALVAAEPDKVAAAYAVRNPQPPAPATSQPRRGPRIAAPKSSLTRQIGTLARRQIRLVVADRGYFGFLVAMPFILGVLALIVPGEAGFGQAALTDPTEPRQILVLLILGACFMGTSLSVRDLVGERSIYFRERAVGLRPGAYLIAKSGVFCAAALVQSMVLVSIVLLGKTGPGPGVLFSSGALELWFDIAVTACCCVIAGLAMSALAKSVDQVMPMLVVSIMCQLVMSGGLINVTGRPVLDQISWLFPARWGFAAGASTIDLRSLMEGVADDSLWQHRGSIWLLDLVMAALLAAALGYLTLRRLAKTR